MLPGGALRLLVVGANGGIGRATVEAALQAGHHVTAVVRNPASLPLTRARLHVVQGDILQAAGFADSLRGQDVVISAIGIKKDQPTTLYSEGNRQLLQVMAKQGVNRAFFISAAAIEISPAQPFHIRLLTKYVVQRLFGHSYADQRIMEKIIRESAVSWTIVRPPRLTNRPATGRYRVAINQYLPNCLSVSRADVAHFILHHLTDTTVYRAVVELAY